MPNVKVGSVFEISYSYQGIPNSYTIQRGIPVAYSALLFQEHPDLDVRITEIIPYGFSYKSNGTYIAKNVPAFKHEPFITSENDYQLGLEIELIQIRGIIMSYFGRNNSLFATSWDRVAKRFLGYTNFGAELENANLYLVDLVDSIKGKSKNNEELSRNAYEAIKKIKWNRQEACYVSQNLRETYKLKKGNSADINLMLVALLRKLGLQSYPVLFSTRSNGRILKTDPTINKFNYVVAALGLGNEVIYLDATDEYLPYGLIPDKISYCYGLPVIDKTDISPVLIEPTKKDYLFTFTNLVIDSTGTINGAVNLKRLGYNAVNFKNMLKEQPNHDAYIQELEADNSGWVISKSEFNNINDPYADFQEVLNVKYENSITSDVLTIKPLSFIFEKKNPFQKDARELPISFPELKEYTSNVSIQIPNNYKIEELPKSINIFNSDKSITFSYIVNYKGNTISIASKFRVNKPRFEIISYPSIRGMYESMLQKQNEFIILNKI